MSDATSGALPQEDGGNGWSVKWSIKVKWEPCDLWLGVYWTRPEEFIGHPPRRRSRRWYVCLVPCLPIVITRLEKLR